MTFAAKPNKVGRFFAGKSKGIPALGMAVFGVIVEVV